MQQINRPYEGLFITIEGGDGSGKSTLTDRLTQELEKRGYSVVRTREPGGSKLSEYLRELLLNPNPPFAIGERAELLLFLAARAQHIEEKILPALHEGKVVICERFNDSTIAYQGAARHLGVRSTEQLIELMCDLEPTCTLILDLDPAVGMSRLKDKKADRLEKEALQFHQEVRQGYLHLADQYPNRIKIIDAEASPDAVFEAAMHALEPQLMLKPTR